MSLYTKEQLENMLQDVVNELDLSDDTIQQHGQFGTEPSKLVKMVIDQKDKEIAMLKAGMISINK